MSRQIEKMMWFVVGTAVGAGIGMLYAPKTGRDMRKYLAKKGSKARHAIADTGEDIIERSRDFGEEIAGRGRVIYRKGIRLAEDASELIDRGRKIVKG